MWHIITHGVYNLQQGYLLQVLVITDNCNGTRIAFYMATVRRA